MFGTQKDKLFDTPKKTQKFPTSNAFTAFGMKSAAEARPGNGALKYNKQECPFVTEFGNCAVFKDPRAYDAVSESMSKMWSTDPALCIKFAMYLRLITRTTSFPDGSKCETTQRGQGLRNEGILRMMWLAINKPEAFQANLGLYVAAGSWRDIFTMLQTDLACNGWDGRLLDWDFLGNFITAGLENPNTTHLVRKWLPTIRNKKNCNTIGAQANHMIGAWLASKLFADTEAKEGRYKQYRQMKAGGTAHQWQQLISRGQHDMVNFDTVAGRALSLMVSGKYLENKNLTAKYEEWIDAKPVAKFTGYPYELFKAFGKLGLQNPMKLKPYEAMTLEKQFDGLVQEAAKNAETNTSMIVVRDTSCSMTSMGRGTGVTAHVVAKSLALFFGRLLPDGPFANSWIEFNNTATMHQWVGDTVVEQWNNDKCESYGSTNFQGVFDLFCKAKANGVPEEQFPTGILCVSDGMFNPAQDLDKTNVDAARAKLTKAGFSPEFVENFKIVLWDVPNDYYGKQAGHFETYKTNVPNVFHFSGLDGSVITFLTGQKGQDKNSTPQTAEELFEAAMDQQVLNLVQV